MTYIEFDRPINLETDYGSLDDVPASFSADNDGNVTLESVKIGAETMTAAQVASLLVTEAELARQIGFVQDWWNADGWREHSDGAGDDALWDAREDAA